MSQLTGKTALVTGGRQGIGRAIVDRFVVAGAQVITCGRGERPDDLPENVIWQQTDVAQTASVEELRQVVEKVSCQLDILVNNAGIQIEKTVLDSSDDDYDQLMGVNAKGVFLCCRAFIPMMQNSSSSGSSGSIINIGSISGRVSDPGLALYNASKAFVHGLTRSIAVDHGPQIRCNAICPGWIMTGMADAAFALAVHPDVAKKDALARHAMGRFGQPDDIAKAAVWLASDESAFVSGQTFTVDGGLTAASPLNPGLF